MSEQPKKKKKTRKPSLTRRLRRWSRGPRHRIVIPVLNTLVWFMQHLTHSGALRLGRWLGRLGYCFGGKSRQLAISQLQQAGLAHDEAEARKMTRCVFESLCMNVVETLQAPAWSDLYRAEVLHIVNPEYLVELYEQGKGSVAILSHAGNWEFSPFTHYQHFKREAYAAMSESSNPYLNEWVQRFRENFGGRVLFAGSRGLTLLKSVRRGYVLGLLADQDSKTYKSIYVDFFGRPARTAIGPALLARQAKVPIVPAFMHREEQDPRHHYFTLYEPLWPDYDLDEEEDIERLTQAHTSALEAHIRKHPTQWAWVHARWHHQPKSR